MEEKPITIWAREALFTRSDRLPDKLIDQILEKYHYRFYEEKSCQQCEFLFERPGPMCEDCGANQGAAILSRELKIDGISYLKMPIGDADSALDLFDDFKIKYKLKSDHPRVPIKRKITFTGNLYDYQRTVVDTMHSERRGVVKAPPRSGKCIVGDSLIMTPRGINPIADLFTTYSVSEENETVIDTDNLISTYKGSRKISHLYTKVVDHTVKFSTEAGYTTQGTPNHRVQVMRSDLSLAWVRLDELTEGDYVAVSRNPQWLCDDDSLLKAESVKTITPSKLTPELARLLGYWVANGALSIPGRVGISSDNSEVKQDFLHCMQSSFPEVTSYSVEKGIKSGGVYASSLPVWDWLQDACGLTCGVAREKSIPPVIMRASKHLMLEFLSAYLSCDSWIAEDGIELCSASKLLIDQLHTVLSFLGVVGKKGSRVSFARNGSGIERDYFEIWLHLNEARTLLDMLNIRKSYILKEVTFTNQNDLIPYAREFLRDTQNSSGTQNKWVKDGVAYSKSQYGRLTTEKDLRVGRPFSRGQLHTVNVDLLKWLSPERYSQWMAATDDRLYFTPVISVEHVSEPVRVYDVCVPGEHHFVANGVVNHNTVCGSAFICEVGEKAIILASQREWLLGFQETFIGSETQPAMTDCLPSQIGFCKKPSDFDKYDICLVTPQTFLRHPEWLDEVCDKASVVIVDEVRLSAAPKYSKVIAALNTRHFIGLDGTPSRSKDCVAPGTLISKADGSYVAIENIQTGDLVKTYDTATGTLSEGTVVELHTRENSELVRVTIDETEIICTPDHKFWCENRSDWVPASKLTVDDVVLFD
jgi:intein/homing endonuclease